MQEEEDEEDAEAGQETAGLEKYEEYFFLLASSMPDMTQIPSQTDLASFFYPPTDGKGFTISENLKSCEGPVLKCRGSRKRGAFYVNELVIHEIRNNASAIFQNFLFSCCKIEFVQLW
jgi:hypothetical protein